MGDDLGRLYRLDGVTHIARVINDEETFGECPAGADEETVRRFARAYIMMLLGTHLFADKSGNRIHIRWLPYIAKLEEMGTYSWGSAALAWLYRYMCRVANRHVVKWSGYNPSGSEKGPRVQMWRLRIDMLQARNFIWMPYSSPEVLHVVHLEVLEPRHTVIWRSVTSLIYFAVIEWHQIDRVLPQFGGVQPRPQPALNIDFLMSKDGRGGEHPKPSHDFLEWWSQHGKRFLSPDMYLGDSRAVSILVEATQRGAGRVPDMDRVDDVPNRRRVERRARVGTRRSQREWRWLDQAMDEGDATVDVEVDDEGTEANGERVLRRTITVIMVTTTTMISTGPWGRGDVGGHAGVGGVRPLGGCCKS
ncbi:hypothetical protein Ahy_B06g083340 [Arachis hypogaea]|uniref:Aminotransferase-like plant mobile domain-containing protein n=1 Tax=Arachis hypogaea TaxID=3818 RepID=A0A444YPM2_ARAHY|nr:hypothetical protein Ahy_B06g083340 [Arachis hypogaea]